MCFFLLHTLRKLSLRVFFCLVFRSNFFRYVVNHRKKSLFLIHFFQMYLGIVFLYPFSFSSSLTSMWMWTFSFFLLPLPLILFAGAFIQENDTTTRKKSVLLWYEKVIEREFGVWTGEIELKLNVNTLFCVSCGLVIHIVKIFDLLTLDYREITKMNWTQLFSI